MEVGQHPRENIFIVSSIGLNEHKLNYRVKHNTLKINTVILPSLDVDSDEGGCGPGNKLCLGWQWNSVHSGRDIDGGKVRTINRDTNRGRGRSGMLAEVERQGVQILNIQFEARTCPERQPKGSKPKAKKMPELCYIPPCTRRCIPASVIIYE